MTLKGEIKKIVEEVKEEGKVIAGEKSKDKLYSSEKDYGTEEFAKSAFKFSKEKLFDVNAWSEISGFATSTFVLYNHRGESITAKRPVVGDYLKILLPGPLPENWVRVTDIKEESDFAEFTVHPSIDPTKEVQDKAIEHFFHKEASSKFKVERKGSKIFGYEIGKNEGINNEGKEAGDRPVLNTLISEGGWAFFQELQWKSLTDYLVDIENF